MVCFVTDQSNQDYTLFLRLSKNVEGHGTINEYHFIRDLKFYQMPVLSALHIYATKNTKNKMYCAFALIKT